MSKIAVISILSLLFFTAGCTYWHQDGKSYNDCEKDLQQCYSSLQEYADMNSIGSYEVDFVKDCMKQKGYKLVSEHKLPQDVRRRDPVVDTFWLLAGVSGTVEK